MTPMRSTKIPNVSAHAAFAHPRPHRTPSTRGNACASLRLIVSARSASAACRRQSSTPSIVICRVAS
eukprot:31073-Pelagococcus_subviridis.AAC.11